MNSPEISNDDDDYSGNDDINMRNKGLNFLTQIGLIENKAFQSKIL